MAYKFFSDNKTFIRWNRRGVLCAALANGEIGEEDDVYVYPGHDVLVGDAPENGLWIDDHFFDPDEAEHLGTVGSVLGVYWSPEEKAFVYYEDGSRD